MTDTVNVVIDGAPVEVKFYDDNTLEAQQRALQADAAKEAAEAAQAASEVARDAAADLVLPQNKFIDVSLGTAEAAVSTDTVFELVSSTTGIADIRKRTSGGSVLLYQQPTKTAFDAFINQVIERGFVNVKDKGAVGDGETDDTGAFEAAKDDGRLIFAPKGRYVISDTITVEGALNIFGEGEGTVLLSDGIVFEVFNGSGSTVDNLRMENITTPWTIQRDADDWAAVPTVSLSNDGYQPTINDQDIWGSLTSEQQAQDIGPKLIFQGDADNIQVTRIFGRFVSIMIYDAINSNVEFCKFKAGKNFVGGIFFWNANGQLGRNNWIRYNVVEEASFSGWIMARNVEGGMVGNKSVRCGESGMKIYQDDVVIEGETVDLRCYRMRIEDNDTEEAFYDGFDVGMDFYNSLLKGSKVGRHTITGNRTRRNRRTGFFGDGQENTFVDNEADDCGLSGIELAYSNSRITKNDVRRCNLSNTASGTHQLQVIGDGNAIENNFALQTVSNGAAIYMPGTNFTRNNNAVGGEIFEGNRGSITSDSAGNKSEATTRNEHTVPVGFRQNSDSEAALRLYSEGTGVGHLDIDFFTRLGLLSNPVAAIRAILALGVNGAELGHLRLYATQDGNLLPGLTVATSNSVPDEAWVELHCTDGFPDGGATGQVGWAAPYRDEATNKGGILFKYSNGTYRKLEGDLVSV